MNHWLSAHQIFIVKGGLDITSPHKCKIKANELVPIDLFFQEWPTISKISCQLPPTISSEMMSALATLFQTGTVSLEFIFTENSKRLRLNTSKKVTISKELLEQLDNQRINPRCMV